MSPATPNRPDRLLPGDQPMLHTDPPRTLHRRELLARAGLAAAALTLAPPLALAARRGHDSFLDWVEIRPGVFATTDATTGGNCLAAAGDDGATLIDTKYTAFAARLRRDAEALTGAPLRRVINTHHHLDHTSGNIEFVGSIPVIAHRNAAPRVREQLDRHRQSLANAPRQGARVPERFREQVQQDLARFTDRLDDLDAEAWAPDTLVASGRTGLDLGARWLEMIQFARPAHTDNDLVIRLPKENVVHTGDLVFNGLHPFFDPEGGGSARGWIDTLREILTLCNEQTVIVPGHGPIAGPDAVRAQLRYIESLWEAVEREIDADAPLDEIRNRTWPFMEGLGFEAVRERAILFVYAEILAGRS